MKGGEALLALWRGSGWLAHHGAPAFLGWRRRRGKEHPVRWREKLGKASLPRPDGPLAWLHGASVGETVALLPLVEALCAQGFAALVTSGTAASARMMQTRLPAGAMHQFAPLDTPQATGAFLDHWRPSFAMIAESELWPNMIAAVDESGVPLVLVNARLSERSFRRWQKAPGFIHEMLDRFDICLAQTQGDAARLMQLGAARVLVAGNLKYDVPPPPADGAAVAQLSGQIGARPVWVAASTHDGEEEIVFAVHRALAERFPTLLTILAPRHAPRGDAIAALGRARGLNLAQRSKGEALDRDTQIYLADTMGEIGLFYRLTSVVYVGKSLAGGGGQNPIEPAKLGAAILHGPQVQNFEEVYEALDASGGARIVADADALTHELRALLSTPSDLRKMARAAADAVDALGGAAQRVESALEPYFAQMLIERR